MNKRQITLHIAVSVLIFLILIGSGVMSILALLLVRIIYRDLFLTAAPLTLISVAFVASTVIGTGISLFVSRFFLKPVDTLIESVGKIAKGDFSVRMTNKNNVFEITELINSVNNMAEELGRTEMFRNDFINNFSHEFKTPIVSIKGFAKQLQKDNISEEQKKEYIDIIVNESDRLASMSSNILLLTKFENQQIVTDKTKFYLDEQIRKCILLLEKQWSRKNINLNLDLKEILYYSNEEMMSHIWLNILGNAVKFTPDGGTIAVKCYQDLNSVSVIVSDNGIGMDDKTQKHIFDKFYQGDSSHKSSGNGLGLALARRVVILCGGKISVKSQKGKGTTFIVRLPVTNQQ